jgi:hypothetical protein
MLDPKTLDDLESHGYSLSEILGAKSSLSKTNELYHSNSFYKSFADTIGRPLVNDLKTDQLPAAIPADSGDIPNMVREIRGFEDKGARYFIRHLSNNSQYPYAVEQDGDEPRHFDERWLRSEFGFFKLVAVVNRMDRLDITKDSCGEVRFIYRLAYQSKTSKSTLPFFVNVVEQYPKQASCAEFAKAWQSGDLRKALAKLSFRQLESNFQSLRFTSGYMRDFGGQAMYMQRIFRKNGSILEPVALENTPDVDALLNNEALRKDFIDYLKRPENMKAIDEGTIDLDPKYLTRLSVSWSTLGRAREANRPFSQVFHAHPELLADLNVNTLHYIKSKDAFIERLDNLSCMGCHQAGGTAGFHLLGLADPKFSQPFNRQQVGRSPHALAEESRRLAWVDASALGKEPNHFRPHSTSPAADWSKEKPVFEKLSAGQLCFPADDFANQASCGDAHGRATECRKTVSGAHVILGECVLKSPAAGSVCWQGDLQEGRKGIFAFTDQWKLKSAVLENKGAYSCVLPQSGAPLGRMSRPCTLPEENFNVDFSKGIPDELCANQGGQGFDRCAASGDSGACLETKVARSMLDSCQDSRACREDYICQQFPDYQNISKIDYVRRKGGKLINLSTPDKINGQAIARARALGIGFCVPTYFLFNMRLDGHPSPITGLAPGAPQIDRSLPVRGYSQ